MLKEIKIHLTNSLVEWLEKNGVVRAKVEIEQASRSEFGDFSTNIAMRYAKVLSKNPFDLAEEVAEFLRQNLVSGIERIEVVRPGFINFYLTSDAKIQHLSTIHSRGSEFGINKLHQGERWVIEHTSPNPNKAMHIGHLRLNLIGMSIVRLIEHAGATVIADCVYNDRGIAIAKVMYGYLAHMKKREEAPTSVLYWAEQQDSWYTPIEKEMKPDVFVSECYVKGEELFSSSPEIEKQVRNMVVDWEAGDEVTWQLWRQVLSYAYEGNERVLARLGSRWDKVWYEHEHYALGKAYVDRGLEQGIFTKLEDGAVLTQLEAYGLPDTIVLKNDGTSLYITQDIALTDLKKKTYDADKLVWVIGPEQTLALKQLFAVCEQLGIGKLKDFTHVSYGKVGLKNETGSTVKMSSRAGTVILAEEVIDAVKEQILIKFNEENKHQGDKKEGLAEKLAVGAVKFSFLKPDKNQDMAFDITQALEVQGDSGMYVLYTYVRTRSILKKAGGVGASGSHPTSLGLEADLLRYLLFYEETVEKAVVDLSVHHVAQYLLELCSLFNGWYSQETILDGSDREAYKLQLVEAVGITIKNGLALLGIDTVEEI
jgi:arginyl-tRNA synthetase